MGDLTSEVKAAGIAAETATRAELNAKRASKGWLVRILPIGIILVAVCLFVLQMASGIPLYNVLSNSNCKATSTNVSYTDDGEEVCTGDTYTDGQMMMARLIVGMVFVGIIWFLYEIFERGPASGLISGRAGQSSALDTRRQLQVAALRSQQEADRALSLLENSKATLPSGAADLTSDQRNRIDQAASSYTLDGRMAEGGAGGGGGGGDNAAEFPELAAEFGVGKKGTSNKSLLDQEVRMS